MGTTTLVAFVVVEDCFGDCALPRRRKGVVRPEEGILFFNLCVSECVCTAQPRLFGALLHGVSRCIKIKQSIDR